MGIMDDLGKMAKGEPLSSVFGYFGDGDRVALRVKLWTEMQTRTPPGVRHFPVDDYGKPDPLLRFGTVFGASEGVIMVQHDSDGVKREWHAEALIAMEAYLDAMRNVGGPGCMRCCGTNLIDGQPGNPCPCHTETNYNLDDDEWRRRRRANRGDR